MPYNRKEMIYDGCFFHVAWQCHNKNWLFKDERMKRLYYDLLIKYRQKYDIIFHAYHFMENHIHLVGRAGTVKSFSDFFRIIHSVFAIQFNHRKHRRGQVVMERLRSLPIENDESMLRVMAYVDLNGVRAGRDKIPEDSLWSSYRYYAYGKEDDLITPAPSYLELAENDKERQNTYQDIVKGLINRQL